MLAEEAGQQCTRCLPDTSQVLYVAKMRFVLEEETSYPIYLFCKKLPAGTIDMTEVAAFVKHYHSKSKTFKRGSATLVIARSQRSVRRLHVTFTRGR